MAGEFLTPASAQNIPLAPYARGVVGPHPGQEDSYCGVAACTVFREMLINALVPHRYSKVCIDSAIVTAGGPISFAPQQQIAFNYVVDSTGSGGFPSTYKITKAETNYLSSEDPVPQNGGYLFCAVGMTVAAERPFMWDGSSKVYPTFITQGPDYQNTIREELYGNVFAQLAYGNNGCTYDLGNIKYYPTPNTPHGGDVVAPGVIAGQLAFNPFNSVVCIDSLRNNRRAVITVNLPTAFTLPVTTLPTTQIPALPAAATSPLFCPLEFVLFGFIIQVPTTGDFYNLMPQAQYNQPMGSAQPAAPALALPPAAPAPAFVAPVMSSQPTGFKSPAAGGLYR